MALFALLVKPKIGCSTKKIYKKLRSFSKNKVNISSKIFKIQFLKYAKNDLEIPAFKLYPVLRKLKIFLSNINQVEFVRMTGSGSTIVAYFSNKTSYCSSTCTTICNNYIYIKLKKQNRKTVFPAPSAIAVPGVCRFSMSCCRPTSPISASILAQHSSVCGLYFPPLVCMYTQPGQPWELPCFAKSAGLR